MSLNSQLLNRNQSLNSLKSEMCIAGLNFSLFVPGSDNSERFFELWNGLFSSTAPANGLRTVNVCLEPETGNAGHQEQPHCSLLLIETTEIRVFRGKHRFWLSTAGMTCSVTPDEISVSVSSLYWSKTLFEQRDFLLVTMVAALRLNRVYAFHGNGLELDGTGILISGDSGAGKTTLTHSLIASGWSFLADDAIAIETGTDGVVAWALRRGFSLTPEAETRTSPPAIWDNGSIRALGNGKTLASPSGEIDQRFVARTRPSAIFFSKVGDAARTVIKPIPDAAALALALKQAAGLLTDPESTATQLNALRDLVNQCYSYQIITGRDVIGTTAQAAEVSRLVLTAARGERRLDRQPTGEMR